MYPALVLLGNVLSLIAIIGMDLEAGGSCQNGCLKTAIHGPFLWLVLLGILIGIIAVALWRRSQKFPFNP